MTGGVKAPEFTIDLAEIECDLYAALVSKRSIDDIRKQVVSIGKHHFGAARGAALKAHPAIAAY